MPHCRTTLQPSIFVLTSDNKSQPFAKLKEVFYHHTSRPKNTTFTFAQPHPKPTHHPNTDRNYFGKNSV